MKLLEFTVMDKPSGEKRPLAIHPAFVVFIVPDTGRGGTLVGVVGWGGGVLRITEPYESVLQQFNLALAVGRP